jgi:hypoxanthine phosphoribosyltransferase
MKVKKDYFTWKRFVKACYDLVKKIDYKPDVIVAITTGGLTVAGVLSRLLNVTYIETIGVTHYKGDQKRDELIKISGTTFDKDRQTNNILVVDDVCDTGVTLEYVLNYFKEQYGYLKVKSATIHYKPKKAKIKPDYYLLETDKWIVYPWEVEDWLNDKPKKS